MSCVVFARLFQVTAVVSEFDGMAEARSLTRALREKYPSPAHFSYGPIDGDTRKVVEWALLRPAFDLPADDARTYVDSIRDRQAVTVPPRKARGAPLKSIRKAARFHRQIGGSGPVYHQALRKTPKAAR